MALTELLLLFITALNILVYAENKTVCNPNFYREPACIDSTLKYKCECGPGFEWNGHLCVSKAIDSRMEFLERDPVRYTLLLGKNFPKLTAFTISCWLKLLDDSPAGTLLSYANRYREELQVTIGKGVRMLIGGIPKMIKKISFESNQWIHLGITWTGKNGDWKVYKNGELITEGTRYAVGKGLSYGGRLILGQSADNYETIDFKNMSSCKVQSEHHGDNSSCPNHFRGELSYLNIWQEVLSHERIQEMYKDCTFTYCGNAVEWTDFRSGTRGAMKLRWPSKIFQGNEAECQLDKELMCDVWCTKEEGPQCELQFSENILWPRTKAYTTEYMECPGNVKEPEIHNEEEGNEARWRKEDQTTEKPIIRRAFRYCYDGGNNTGIWGVANTDDCQSLEQRERLATLKNLSEETDLSNKTLILLHLKDLKSSTALSRLENPSDLAADIEAVRLLIKIQNNTLDQSKSERFYPTYEDTKIFAETTMKILDNIVDVGSKEREGINSRAWNLTAPRGNEAVQVLEVVNDLADLLVKSLVVHFKWNDTQRIDVPFQLLENNLALFVRLYDTRQFNKEVKFPPSTGKDNLKSVTDGKGEIRVPGGILTEMPEDLWPDYLGISNARFNSLPGLLPNHPEPFIVKSYSDQDKEFLHLEDNINTVILSARVHLDDGKDAGKYIAMTNESDPVEYTLKFSDTRNYSHPECVTIDMDHNYPDYWEWIPEGCEVVDHDREANEAICHCYHFGIFAITTDMYDPDWDPGDPPRFEMNAASYIGILISVSLYGVSLVTFLYLRCETDTVAIHRNLAASVVALQLSFLVGVARTENEIVCKMFAILLHYLMISSFLWVCNEAFNLYTEVANSIHTDTQQQRPMLRYYVIGWVVPAILVGILVKLKWETYFDPEVCLIDVQHIWFLVGPVGGVWIVTVFVLVYTLKDIMESSYMKDKAANKIIANHNKGCWIQNTLLMIAMAFAVCSAIMYSRIPQILFAMFTILQGAFFFMFFCVLNGEVVELLAERRTSLGINVTSPSLPRSTKYSVYKRYVPIRSSSSSRKTSPTHGSGGSSGTSPRSDKKQKAGKGGAAEQEHQSADDRGSPATRGHRTLTTVSSSDSRAESPLIGLGSATLVRKLIPGILKKPEDTDREEGDLATLALRSDSPEQEQPVSKDMVTTV
ncbi:uncharacterized protein [Amphiura filiformis]|uniref:uncharacterized protein isoform X1 n=1 Tax=Amphiura filiformis TaxID=82378 RepID=UPI003B223010